MIQTPKISAPENVSEIKRLTAAGDRLARAVDSWNTWYIWFGVAALVIAFLVFFAQWRIIRKSKELSAVQGDLIAARDRQSVMDSQAKDAKIAELNEATAIATEKAAEAQLELARLTGPPYLVPFIQGTATPDLSKSVKQLVLLTSNTQINLPKLSNGKSLAWTLILAQDARGQHQFSFSPGISGFAPVLYSPGHSKWIVNLLTDSSGTVNIGLGGTFVPAEIPPAH